MKISAKARYGLAAMIQVASRYPYQTRFTVQELSEALKISKIYLEQVFTQLRLAGLVKSTKGPQGGYFLSCPPEEITVYQILAAAETSLFDATPETVGDGAQYIEKAMMEGVFLPLDQTVHNSLVNITLGELADLANKNRAVGYMYYL